MFSLYTILGLEENSSSDLVENAYKQLCESFAQADFAFGSLGEMQSQQCLTAFAQAYKTLSDANLKNQYALEWQAAIEAFHAGELHPKLGQLCVASGMITLQELETVVQSQKSLDLPLGHMLLESKLISQSELDGLLMGQTLITLPAETPQSLGQRLMALGLVSEDMVRIVLIEQRTFGRKIGELLVAHEWVDKDVIEILMTQAQTSREMQK